MASPLLTLPFGSLERFLTSSELVSGMMSLLVMREMQTGEGSLSLPLMTNFLLQSASHC